MRAPSALRRRGSSEDGFTLVEILMALLITSVGIMAVVRVLDTSRALTTQAEKNEVASHIAEREIERVSALPFSEIALAALPSHSTSPSSPDFYVSGTNYQWDQSGAGASEPLLSGGSVQTAATWSDPSTRLSGQTHRYVTTVGGDTDVRRVTVAITISGGDLKRPVLISTIETNPTPHG